MAQRAPTPLVTRTAILGVLGAGGPTHGYELRRQFEQSNMHRWAKIQLGSIYAALKQLTKEGLLAEVEETRDGVRPPKTIYRITAAGREELLTLLRESWVTPGFGERPLDMALFFSPFLRDEEIEGLLDERLGLLKANLDGLAEAQAAVDAPVPGLAAITDDLFEHSRRLVELEIEFAKHVKRRLRRGAYALAAPAAKVSVRP